MLRLSISITKLDQVARGAVSSPLGSTSLRWVAARPQYIGMHVNGMFDLGLVARAYEGLTSQALWRDEISALLALAELNLDRPIRCLDLGCGPGESTFVLAEHLPPRSEVVGIDISRAMVSRARVLAQRHSGDVRLRFEQADATALPFATESFDLAIGHSFLYLVRDPHAVLVETHRLLRPGGLLLLMEPNQTGSLPRAMWRARHHVRQLLRAPITSTRFVASMVLWRVVSGRAGRMSRAELARRLPDAGLTVSRIEPAFNGLGVRCVGRRPPPPSTPARSTPS